MIDVRGLARDYSTLRAIHPMTFHIEAGSVVGLLGRNGAGKSTLLQMMAGTLAPSEGRVLIDERDLAMNPAARERVGFLPESPPLYPEMRVDSFLAWCAELRHIPRARARRLAADAIDRCALASVCTRRIGTLSLGFRKRVGVAQAIVHDPALVLLDEPISGLDPSQIVQMRELVAQLADRRTVIISSHILSEIVHVCDRLLVLKRGRLVADGAPTSLTAEAERSAELELVVTGTKPLLEDTLRAHAGLLTSAVARASSGTWRARITLAEDNREDLVAALVGAGIGVRAMQEVGRSLEDAFLALTGAPDDTHEEE